MGEHLGHASLITGGILDTRRLRRPMQPHPHPRRRIILAYRERASDSFDLVAGILRRVCRQMTLAIRFIPNAGRTVIYAASGRA
jgi:hypothetical protein